MTRRKSILCGYSHLSIIGAAECQSHKMGSQAIIIILIITLIQYLVFAKSSHILFIFALTPTPVQMGICYPHFTDEEYETPEQGLETTPPDDQTIAFSKTPHASSPLSLLIPLNYSNNVS